MSWNPPFDYSLTVPNPGKFYPVAMFIQSGDSGKFIPTNTTTFANSSNQESIIEILTPVSHGPLNSTKSVPTGAAQQIVASPTSATRGVLVSADLENNATVYVGGSGITTSNGLGLQPGDSRFYEVNDANLIYCIATQALQILRIEIL